MLSNHVLLAVCWILFGVIHSLLASSQLKERFKKNSGGRFRYYRLVYNLLALLSLGLIIFYQLSITSVHLFTPNKISMIAGACLSMAGLALMVVCIKKYFTGLSGLKGLWQEGEPTDTLLITGVHNYVRHPLYLGTFLFLWGLVVIFPTLSLLISAFIITAYTLIGIGYEEKKLIRYFGDQYIDYKKQVPKLIPGL